MADFSVKWFDSDSLLAGSFIFSTGRLMPTVLVVADSIFTLGDKQLDEPARLSMPDRFTDGLTMGQSSGKQDKAQQSIKSSS